MEKAKIQQIKETILQYQYECDSGSMDEEAFTDFAYKAIEFLPELIHYVEILEKEIDIITGNRDSFSHP